MHGWLLPILLYALGMSLFGLLGGLASAADALRQWGEHASRKRLKLTSSS